MILLTHMSIYLHETIQYKKNFVGMYVSKALDIQLVLLYQPDREKWNKNSRSTYLRQQNPHTYLLTGMKILVSK
jgi:hypothetical protein